MICIFPDPYPDELLYSSCARYNALMNYPNSVTATQDFFGDGAISAVVDLPNRINHLLNALPLGHLYSANEFIHLHTHYPFYAPFLPSGRACTVRNVMQEGGQNRVAERIGLSADRLKMQSHLRFCPSCVQQDRANYGETYWHRVHQIPGVDVCPHHGAFLEDSNTLWRNSRNPGEAFSAENSVSDISTRTIDTSYHSQSIQLNIARQALWLLESAVEQVNSEILRARYYNLLLQQGLAYYSGKIRTTQLIQKFLDFYPSELLMQLGCEVRNPYSNWLLRLLHEHKVEVAQHPIRHILFLIFIGSSVREIFSSFIEFKPFGSAPWPCLNQASDHYKKPYVVSCQINAGEKKNTGKLVGTFTCSCGFTYTRTGPDQSDDARFTWSSIQSYGSQWENLLKELWRDSSLTLKQIANSLGVNELTVKRRAINLELPFPRRTPKPLRSTVEILSRYKIKRKPAHQIKKQKREALLLLINNNPQASRTKLQTLAPHLIDWLRRWDKEWVDITLPCIKERHPTMSIVNWAEKDILLSAEVKKAISYINSTDNVPRRVSIAAIVKIVGHRAWVEKNLNKLPLTLELLNAQLESFEDYLIRRINWAAETFRAENVIPSRAMFSKRAKLRGRLTSEREKVQRALELALMI